MPSSKLPEEFLRNAVLDTVVPRASDFDIEGALTSSLEEGAADLPSALSSMPQRSLLFFGWSANPEVILLLIHRKPTDETVILWLSNCSESAVKFHLPRLDVRLDAYAINPADSGGEGSGPTKDLIFSGAVSDKEDPLVVVDIFEEDEESENHVYVTWKVKTYLNASFASYFSSHGSFGFVSNILALCS
jgi:hypothetical protein